MLHSVKSRARIRTPRSGRTGGFVVSEQQEYEYAKVLCDNGRGKAADGFGAYWVQLWPDSSVHILFSYHTGSVRFDVI